MKSSTVAGIVITCVVLLVVCLCCILFVSTGVISGLFMVDGDSFSLLDETPQPTPVVIRPENGNEEVPVTTLETLEHTIVPINDLLELASRLEGKNQIPRTVEAPKVPLNIGDQDVFWVTNTDTDENFQINVVLRYATDHAYFWIEEGVKYDQEDLEALAETFENHIYPTNREFFGSEWSPGVDGDPHLYIVYATGLGRNLAGYYSSADEYPPLAHEYSNAHETFMLNADNILLDEEFTYGVLAHEFQHMIHWYQDRNETTWLNEGFAELAAFLNGYGVGGSDYLYVNDPDLQLNDWPNDPNKTSPHYGAAFLFVTYFLDRFGESVTQALVGHPVNGMTSVDTVLMDVGAIDPVSSDPITADDIFFDWVLASFVQDPDVADGRFVYHNYPDAPQPDETETIRTCPSGPQTRDVNQYGVDYVRIDCRGEFTLHFEGSTQVGVLPVNPYQGDYAFWSNKGDESDMTLTRTFDFQDADGPLTLDYWVWYDIEEDYDYVYLEASLDDGETWQILTTPSGTAEDPSGNSYGWGYNGLSGGGGIWIQEQVSLAQFAGEQIQIRFEYITDAAVNGEGFMLDNVSIPETGYFEDFEDDSGGWESAGFVRIQNVLPQTFRLALIINGVETEVDYIQLNEDNTVEVPLEIDGDIDDVVFVVAGTTRFTRQRAAYRYEILP